MGSDAKRFRVQDLGLSGRDALPLLNALGGQAADLDVAAEELTPGTLAATILFAARTATGELRPGMAGTLAEYEALAARIAGMDPRDAFRVEGWVAGCRDAEDHGGALAVRRAARAERAGATPCTRARLRPAAPSPFHARAHPRCARTGPAVGSPPAPGCDTESG